jgi:hypothetical protein
MTHPDRLQARNDASNKIAASPQWRAVLLALLDLVARRFCSQQ